MTYDQLLPVYRQITGRPGQDADFNQWVQSIINASGSQQGIDGIPDNWFSTPAGQQFVAGASTNQATNPAQTPVVAPGSSPAPVAPDLETSLRAYFNSEPAFQNEFARASASGDPRSAEEWMYDHIQSNPGDLQKFTGLVNSGTIQTAPGAGNQMIGGDVPLEQALLDMALPGLLTDIEGDAQRRALAQTLTGQAVEDYNLARDALSPEENARRLAEEYAMADTTAGAISQSAATASAEQLAALNASIEAMKGNLNADLAARAQALQQQIATLTANLGTLDATQKAALAEQIAAQQANLETSIAAQRQNLTAEAEALRGAADAQSVARLAALTAEIDGLTAAQAPMAQARLDSANALTTAVNLGLESTNDRLTAERARQGYLGSSSFSDASLARAAIGARQQAAQAMGGARELNAADIRAIDARRATEGRSIADQLSGNMFDIAGREATGGRTLADMLAEGRRGISDTGAIGNTAIRNSTAQGLFGIQNAGANQTYADKTMGSAALRSLMDELAKGQGAIGANLATQQQTARDSGTVARQGYFDNAYTRGQGAILSRPGLSTNLASTLTGLGNYGSTGTNRALNTLNWWASNGGPAPTPGYTPTQADTTGNDIAGLGAGLLSAGLSYGNANNWWQKPKTTTSS